MHANANAEDEDSYGSVGEFLFQKPVLLQKGARKTMNPILILMDNKSTSDVFNNTRLVQNIGYSGGI